MKVTINDINIEKTTAGRIVENIDKQIQTLENIPFENMIKNSGYVAACRIFESYKRRISNIANFLEETGIMYDCCKNEIDDYFDTIFQNRILANRDGRSYFKWNNQNEDLWPRWFIEAIEKGAFIIDGRDLYLVTNEGDCGDGRYLIDQGDYAVDEMFGSYSSRNCYVIETEWSKQ